MEENGWKEGKILRFTKGATAVIIEGLEKTSEGKDNYINVKESIQPIIRGAGWGCKIRYRTELVDTKFGKFEGISAVEILEKVQKPRATNSFKRSPIETNEIIMQNALDKAYREYELRLVNGGIETADKKAEPGWDRKDIEARALEIARFIKSSARKLAEEFPEGK